MPTFGLSISPLDTLFFRDGRPFAATSRVASNLPLPQTLAGCIRSTLLERHGFDRHAFNREQRSTGSAMSQGLVRTVLKKHIDPQHHWIIDSRLRGPFLCLQHDKELIRLHPTPQNLQRIAPSKARNDAEWIELVPRDKVLPGWNPEHAGLKKDMLPLWPEHVRDLRDADHPGGFLTDKGIQAWLDGKSSDLEKEFFDAGQLFALDARIGIKILSDSLVTESGFIYAVQLLATNPKIGQYNKSEDTSPAEKEYCGSRVLLAADLIVERDDLQGSIEQSLSVPFPFGGEGRCVSVHVDKRDDSSASGDATKWYLASPGIFGDRTGEQCWCPNYFAARDALISAASSYPIAISGWDVALNGPRPTRFAVPAGCVYFTHPLPVPKSHSLCEFHPDQKYQDESMNNEELINQGYGYTITNAQT